MHKYHYSDYAVLLLMIDAPSLLNASCRQVKIELYINANKDKNMWINIIGFLLVVVVCVFVHEWGHFIAARKCGVRILAFSIGMGKSLFSWVDSKGTKWLIGALPIGGYVKMLGQDDLDPTEHGEISHDNYQVKSNWQKLCIIAAGPIANLVLAIVLIAGLLFVYGKSTAQPIVASVLEGSPAYAIIEPGDTIVSVNGGEIQEFDDIKRAISTAVDTKINIMLLRQSVQSLMQVDVVIGADKLLGITANVVHADFTLRNSIIEATNEAYDISMLTLRAIYNMIVHDVNRNDIGGILKIAMISGDSLRSGMKNFIWFIAMLSLNLFIFNILPIPVLDGGHIVLIIISALRGKEPSERFVKYFHTLGFVMLIFIAVFATYNDIKSILIA